MKRLVSSLLLTVILVSGFAFVAQTDTEDLTYGGERHPPVVRGLFANY